MDAPARRQYSVAVLLMAAISATLLHYLVDPVRAAWFPPCPLHRLTGLDCPGCGSARGLHALLHGHVAAALDYNLLLIPGMLFTSLGIYSRFSGSGAGLWSRLDKPSVVLWVVVAFWVLRNIPIWPLTWLNSGR